MIQQAGVRFYGGVLPQFGCKDTGCGHDHAHGVGHAHKAAAPNTTGKTAFDVGQALTEKGLTAESLFKEQGVILRRALVNNEGIRLLVEPVDNHPKLGKVDKRDFQPFFADQLKGLGLPVKVSQDPSVGSAKSTFTCDDGKAASGGCGACGGALMLAEPLFDFVVTPNNRKTWLEDLSKA